jgi:hypothetical protein
LTIAYLLETLSKLAVQLGGCAVSVVFDVLRDILIVFDGLFVILLKTECFSNGFMPFQTDLRKGKFFFALAEVLIVDIYGIIDVITINFSYFELKDESKRVLQHSLS